MADIECSDDIPRADKYQHLTTEQVQGLCGSVAATIMPLGDGWRVQYVSKPSFVDEPGSDFPTFDAAITAISQVLPAVNSDGARTEAHAELEARHQNP